MANAWIRMKHEDYDELRDILNHVGSHRPGASKLNDGITGGTRPTA